MFIKVLYNLRSKMGSLKHFTHKDTSGDKPTGLESEGHFIFLDLVYTCMLDAGEYKYIQPTDKSEM